MHLISANKTTRYKIAKEKKEIKYKTFTIPKHNKSSKHTKIKAPKKNAHTNTHTYMSFYLFSETYKQQRKKRML